MAHKSRLINIFIGDKHFDTMPADVLSFFDSRAFTLSRQRGGGHQWTWRRVSNHINETAALTVLNWIRSEAHKPRDTIQPLLPHVLPFNHNQNKNNNNHDHPPTTPTPIDTEPDFPSCVALHAAMDAFTIRPELSSFAVREAVVTYIGMAPLTLEEFALLVEQCGRSDPTLVRLSIRALKQFRQEGVEQGFVGAPDWHRIRTFCWESGMEEFW